MESANDVAMIADEQALIKTEENSLEVLHKNGAEVQGSVDEEMKTQEGNGSASKSDDGDESSDVQMTTDGSDPVAPSVEGQPTGRTGFTSEIFKIELNGIPKFFGANQVH
jgi:hypothetical protein